MSSFTSKYADPVWYWLYRLVKICLLSLLGIGGVLAQVTGVVYRDFNENGTRNFNAATPLLGEIGVGGVTVTLYGPTGAVVATTTTSSASATQGQFSLVPLVGGPYRLQFTNLPSGYFAGVKGTQSGTTVQFINNTTLPAVATANLGINYPSDYCQANPSYLVPCYVNGNSTGATGTGTAASQPVLISLPYSSTGNNPVETPIALNSAVGTVYGLAFQRATNQLYSAAFVKRHSGLGPGGAGAIYLTRVVGGAPVTSTFVSLSAGTVASNTSRGLPDNVTAQNQDPTVFDQVGKAGLGDIELSEDGTQLYAVNLADRTLYQIPVINSNTATPTAGTPVSFALPTVTQRTGSVFRPFALKVYRGRVYVGGVTTNEATPTSTTFSAINPTSSTPGNLIVRDTTSMRAVVFEFNPATSSFAQVLSFPLTYKKGATNNDKTGIDRSEYWLPWTNILPATGQIPNRFSRADLPNASYPQPWLTGIEFEVDGNMIISIRDRAGDQFGNFNFGPNNTTQYRIIAPGDILLAGKCNPAVNQWTIESNARVCGGTPTLGAGNLQGIGGGEYYYSDALAIPSPANPYHSEMSEGGLALLPGSGDVSSVVLDPTDQIDAGGIRRFRNSDGSGSPVTSVQIYQSNNVSTYGKANGLGDLELNCAPAPIEIGNRIWNDGSAITANGIQDNGVSPLVGVTVQLYQSVSLVASTTSDANGEYYFNSTNVPGGLLPFTAYELRVPLSQTALSGPGYVPVQANAGADREIDSDARLSGGNAIISLTTGYYGENSHTYDFGFATCPTITNPNPPGAVTVCSGTPVQSLTVATTATGSGVIQFVYFTAPQSGTAMYVGGTTLGTATPASGTAGVGNVAFPANTGATPITYYVYAILNPTPNADECRPSQQFTVTVNPRPVASATGGVVTCAQSATVSGSSSLAGSSFAWTGPGSFVSSAASFTTSTPGVYTLTVTANGCSSVPVTTTVTQNTTPPQGLALASSGPLTCTATTVQITASSSSTGLSYAFIGPGVVSSAGAVATVNQPGSYTVVVATAPNGCTAVATTTVTQNTTPPQSLALASSGPLNCTATTVQITASSSSTGLSYAFAGPGIVSSAGTTATVNQPGTYTVRATSPNGCTATATVIVTQNVTLPQALSLTPSGPLTCTATTVQITASSSTTGLSYAFTGPGVVSSAGAVATVNQVGAYTVKVTAPNGCTATATTTVTQNITPPQALNLTASSPLSCTATTVQLTASSSTTGLSYAFAGPGVVSTTAAVATVNQVGTYTVTATGTNGCTATASATVSQTLASATLVQGVCNDNNTNTNLADDYFFVTVRATAGASGAGNRFEVVLNGTVLNPGGTVYGQAVTVGSASPPTFLANGTSTYTLTIRDRNAGACQITRTTVPVASCSSCDFVLCPKVNLTKRSL